MLPYSVEPRSDIPAPALVASDVDGTLLDPHEHVAERTRRAVGNVVAAGVPFVLATGRPPRWIPPIVEGLGHAPIAVCGNGAVIYDSAADRVLETFSLEVGALNRLAELAYRLLPGCGLAAERVGASAHDAATPQFVSTPEYEHAWLNPDNTAVSLEEVLDAPAIKMLVRVPSMTSEAMRKVLEPNLDGLADLTYSSNHGLIELSAPGITKASGLAQVARLNGIALDRIVAFGDMPNDVPMLTMAGHGVAMGNAHAQARAAADEITASNADDGVAKILERWW
ncbi:MAG: HAD family hydrolase [Mycobacteriaceae bacterium]|nr:HAD family hydrolase [Mycobacteriaceae bacterium]